jgi:hypothetical protein
MKQRLKNFRKNTMAVLLLIASATALAVIAAPVAQADKADKAKTTRSVFILPSNSKEGCDPFFPKSNRPYEMAAAANMRTGNITSITSLVLKGFSGSQNHRLVIINNHSFAAGDTGDVITSDGRVHLRCIEIKTNSAVVEVGGQRYELIYSNKP